jgi:hypothetical protein
MAANLSKIPTHIIILGKKIKIKKPRKLVDELGQELFGLFDHDKMVIHVSQSKDHNKYSTFLHEILHAILFISGHNETLEHEQEEAIIRAIEHGLFPILEVTKWN